MTAAAAAATAASPTLVSENKHVICIYFVSPIIYYYYFDFMQSPPNPRCHLSQNQPNARKMRAKRCIRQFGRG